MSNGTNEFEEMNRRVIAEFRDTGGKAGGFFDGKPLLLVHHIGAKSGAERVAPLVPYLEGDRIFVIASKGGADTNPDWYRNLLAHPDVTVELGQDTIAVHARELIGAERDAVYAKQVAVEPQFADYQEQTHRITPVLELVRR